MFRLVLIAILMATGLAQSTLAASDESPLPNVLWITSEDNSFQWLGCYGDKQARTPRLDALAASGVQFNHAYSNAPVCAVARSTLLYGTYAVTLGTQHMRSRYEIPVGFLPYVQYLRSAGYYCTNNSKTDYNRKGSDRTIWDQCSRKSHYKNRPEGSPFFAVFNLAVCHESSLFPQRVEANRKQGVIPETPRLAAADVEIPPYLPDLPEMRSDFAIYHDYITALDTQVGALLDDLQRRGLSDDTIVFYYADHGGPTPRGKRYLTDTGVRVPMLIHVPEKWQHLSPFRSGEITEELVAFVDLAPTLSLCGIETPQQMQGRAFLGKHRKEPNDDSDVFLIADRFDELGGMRRGVTDGRFKYIRCFTPHLPAAPCSYYSLSMPSWQAWQQAWQSGSLSNEFTAIWEKPQPAERLFDTSADPWEIDNLADDPQHAETLVLMRARLKQRMLDVYDTGLICESLFAPLSGEATTFDFAHSQQFDLQRSLDLAFLASEGDAKNLPALLDSLADADPVLRYWGALGCTILGDAATGAAEPLTRLLEDEQPTVRIAAAHALYAVGEKSRGTRALIRELNNPLSNEASLQLINAITDVGAVDEVPQAWVNQSLEEPSVGVHLKRFSERLRESR